MISKLTFYLQNSNYKFIEQEKIERPSKIKEHTFTNNNNSIKFNYKITSILHPTRNHFQNGDESFMQNGSIRNEFNQCNWSPATNKFSESLKFLINWIFSTKLFTLHLIYTWNLSSFSIGMVLCYVINYTLAQSLCWLCRDRNHRFSWE